MGRWAEMGIRSDDIISVLVAAINTVWRGKYPLGPRVACGTKDDVELVIALIQAVKRVEFEARRDVEICGEIKM
jgi:hypothetical protein